MNDYRKHAEELAKPLVDAIEMVIIKQHKGILEEMNDQLKSRDKEIERLKTVLGTARGIRMSLQKEIESLLMWQDNIQGQDATYQQKASIAINKVLDATVEAVENSRADMWKDAFAGNVQGGIETAIQAINKLRPKS